MVAMVDPSLPLHEKYLWVSGVCPLTLVGSMMPAQPPHLGGVYDARPASSPWWGL